MNKQQTAVEWLISYMEHNFQLTHELRETFEQAKQLEKDQMFKAADAFFNQGSSYLNEGKKLFSSFEQYYNETYKKE